MLPVSLLRLVLRHVACSSIAVGRRTGRPLHLGNFAERMRICLWLDGQGDTIQHKVSYFWGKIHQRQ